MDQDLLQYGLVHHPRIPCNEQRLVPRKAKTTACNFNSRCNQDSIDPGLHSLLSMRALRIWIDWAKVELHLSRVLWADQSTSTESLD